MHVKPDIYFDIEVEWFSHFFHYDSYGELDDSALPVYHKALHGINIAPVFFHVFERLCCVLLWQKGTKAPQAAGKIHTDFEKGFIMAEVMKFSDFKEEGSESAVKVACSYTA